MEYFTEELNIKEDIIRWAAAALTAWQNRNLELERELVSQEDMWTQKDEESTEQIRDLIIKSIHLQELIVQKKKKKLLEASLP